MRAGAWRVAASLRRPAPVADLSVNQSVRIFRQERRRSRRISHHVQRLHHRNRSHTAGIVTKDERSYRFFSSDRIFDALEGREFRSARDAERAARALFLERRHLVSGQLFAAF
jgi:hypothetical protein